MRSSEPPEPDRGYGALARVCDTLLPGTPGGWPSSSAALGEALEQLFDDEVRARLAGCAPAPHASLAALEREAPALFEALLRTLYGAYYSSGAVQQSVRALAEAGPREASPLLDTGLVAEVVRTGAGGRRTLG